MQKAWCRKRQQLSIAEEERNNKKIEKKQTFKKEPTNNANQVQTSHNIPGGTCALCNLCL
jgi:hypothetical protein